MTALSGRAEHSVDKSELHSRTQEFGKVSGGGWMDGGVVCLYGSI